MSVNFWTEPHYEGNALKSVLELLFFGSDFFSQHIPERLKCLEAEILSNLNRRQRELFCQYRSDLSISTLEAICNLPFVHLNLTGDEI
jgi:hypothetical protein